MTVSVLFALISCQNEDTAITPAEQAAAQTVDASAHRGCASHEVLEEQLTLLSKLL